VSVCECARTRRGIDGRVRVFRDVSHLSVTFSAVTFSLAGGSCGRPTGSKNPNGTQTATLALGKALNEFSTVLGRQLVLSQLEMKLYLPNIERFFPVSPCDLCTKEMKRFDLYLFGADDTLVDILS